MEQSGKSSDWAGTPSIITCIAQDFMFHAILPRKCPPIALIFCFTKTWGTHVLVSKRKREKSYAKRQRNQYCQTVL